MRLLHLFVSVIILLLTTNNFTMAELKKGETVHGFKLIEKRFVKEVNSDCMLFEHTRSGARVFKIISNDPNKTFGIGFKTVPQSDCGTPHIIEHSVLNGSRHFPVKSPFDILSKGSLNTFLNAFTGSDMTFYPVASMNDKDYFNLMHIYLDAVFYPLIYDNPKILSQEGWHYEMENPSAPLTVKGVVYNEMKGAFSDPNRELNYLVQKNLFPDNNYKYSSGGYPAAIPDLTYEAFLDFHKKYYHPSNSYILLYGNADVDKELEFIDREYLSNFTKQPVNAEFPIQKSFSAPKEMTGYYPVGENDPVENQTYLTYNFVAGLNTDRSLVMALNILSDVLVNQESAPLRHALREAGIGQDVYASLNDLQQNVLQIGVRNAKPGDREKFREILFSTLRKAAESGLDRKTVEGTLNRMEFRLREGDDAQKGITYSFSILPTWFFDNDPFSGLEYEKPLADLRTGITNGLLETVIRKYMLDNPHALMLTLEPSQGLEKKNSIAAEEKLAAYKKSLSEAQINEIVKNTNELIEYQKREDTPEALATIPMLSRKDINPKAEWYTVEEEKAAGVPLIYHEEFTNSIVYSKFMFDMRTLPADLIPYAALLTEVFTSQNTDNYSYTDLENELNLHTGEFSSYLATYLEDQDPGKMIPKFVIGSKVLNTKTGKLFDLAGEILCRTKFNDTERMKSILTRYQSRLEEQTKDDGFSYARLRLSSYITNPGIFREITRGIEYYWFITDLTDNYDKKATEIAEKLTRTAKLLFSKENLIVAVTSDKKDLGTYTKDLDKFVSVLYNTKPALNVWKFDIKKKNEGFMTTSKIQYVISGFNFKSLGYQWNGKLRVLEQVLSTDWLQTQLRVIGGAYGGYSSFGQDGTVIFASYRDPNLKETVKNYEATPEYLGKFNAGETDMTRYIIGTIAQMDNPLTPSDRGNIALKYYFEKTKAEDVQKERQEVLNTTAENIREMKKMVFDVLAQKAICVYGNEEKIKSESDLFDSTLKITK